MRPRGTRDSKMVTQAQIDRFWAKVVVDDVSDCWIWVASLSGDGYGQFMWPDRAPRHTHRVAYATWRGDIEPGKDIDHLCRRRACCNPWHMEVVSQRVNILRGSGYCSVASRKTHCHRGHELSGDNLIREPTRFGISRQCRACKRIRRRERKERLERAGRS